MTEFPNNSPTKRAHIQHVKAQQCREVAAMLDDRHARRTLSQYADELDQRAAQLERTAQAY